MIENETKLICPICGQELDDLFCPIHGKEGIPRHTVNKEPDIEPVNTKPVCPKCGFNYQENAVFCDNCGAKIENEVITPETKNEVEEVLNIVVIDPNAEVRCPVCKKDDKVLRITSVVSDGIKVVNQSGPMFGVGLNSDGKLGVGIGGHASSGTSVSAKSTQLLPPTKPKRLGCFVYGALISVGLAMSIDKRYAFMIILAIGLCILLFVNNNKKYDERMKVYEALNAQWGKLYYCDRDDLVFQPGTNFVKRAEELQRYYEDSLR
jgi:hypothetical protein